MSHQVQFGEDEWKLAYSVALRVLKSPAEAEDVAQDALLRAYRARDQYEGRARFNSWLYRIAYTTALSHLRKPHQRVQRAAARDDAPADGALAELPSNDLAADAAVEASELAASMTTCLDQLRDKDRLAFTERFLNGTSEKELGTLLGVSTNAAKQRAFRARRAVRACVSADGYTPQSEHATT